MIQAGVGQKCPAPGLPYRILGVLARYILYNSERKGRIVLENGPRPGLAGPTRPAEDVGPYLALPLGELSPKVTERAVGASVFCPPSCQPAIARCRGR